MSYVGYTHRQKLERFYNNAVPKIDFRNLDELFELADDLESTTTARTAVVLQLFCAISADDKEVWPEKAVNMNTLSKEVTSFNTSHQYNIQTGKRSGSPPQTRSRGPEQQHTPPIGNITPHESSGHQIIAIWQEPLGCQSQHRWIIRLLHHKYRSNHQFYYWMVRRKDTRKISSNATWGQFPVDQWIENSCR